VDHKRPIAVFRNDFSFGKKESDELSFRRRPSDSAAFGLRPGVRRAGGDAVPLGSRRLRSQPLLAAEKPIREPVHRFLKKSSAHVFNRFATLIAMLPFRPCYSEIGMRLAPTAQAATVFLAGQQALLFTVVLNFL
jgi:hypothetical protein